MRRILVWTFLLTGLCASSALGQNWGWVSGTVTDATTGEVFPGVSMVITGSNFGTASNRNGLYRLHLPTGRYAVQFSFVGYATRTDSIVVERDLISVLDVSLRETTVGMDEIVVEGTQTPTRASVFTIDPRETQNVPAPMKDLLRQLKTVPGVVTNNELSFQYSVRGGGFNENLIFVEGFEIFLPFRPRQGEQEGLSLLNPELAEKVQFYTGGFPARYGGKLSSALEVTYRNPYDQPIRGSAYASLLDAGIQASSSALNGKIGWVAGVRKARASRFFSTQDLKGSYEPDYTDVQARVSYRPLKRLEIEAIGMSADHEFVLNPNSRKVFFGTVSSNSRIAPSNLKSLFTSFDPDNIEEDGYNTLFLAGKVKTPFSQKLTANHGVAYYRTRETELMDLSGSSILFLVDPGGDPDTGEGLLATGTSRQEDSADNRVEVFTFTGQGEWTVAWQRHLSESGWYARHLEFDDRLNERSVVIGPDLDGEIIEIVADSLEDSASLTTSQFGFYVQDEFDVFADQKGLMTLSTGVRADYYDLTGEWTVSPRVSATYRYNANLDIVGSVGVYYQAPTYRELRGKPETGETILGAINRDLKSQRSIQAVGGFEYFMPRKRFTLRTEAYVKKLDNVISYDIENVRVRYSGENDASGTAFGLDAQLRGEFVPGLESRINYSFLHAREDFRPEFETEYISGSIPRPTDQAHTVSVFVQDYIPNDPRWRIHMRTLYGSGLPYTPPVPGEQIGNLQVQAPGPRNDARYPQYFRFDLGATFEVAVFGREQSRKGGAQKSTAPVKLTLTGEILNLFNMTNTVAFYWVPAASGIWNRVPTRLTPRTVNVRARLEF